VERASAVRKNIRANPYSSASIRGYRELRKDEWLTPWATVCRTAGANVMLLYRAVHPPSTNNKLPVV
jgi:hypothetical protein